MRNKQATQKTLVDAIDLTIAKIKKDKSHILIDRQGDVILAADYVIEKIDDFYKVTLKKQILYSEIHLLDSALALVEATINKKQRKIDRILECEKLYDKWAIEIMYFSAIYQDAACTQYNKLALQDRYDIAKDHIDNIREELRRFRKPV